MYTGLSGPTRRNNVILSFLLCGSRTADALLGIDEVQEVCVTEGDIGYMVKAKFDEKTYEKVEKSIAEVAGPRYGRFVSAMELKKAIK